MTSQSVLKWEEIEQFATIKHLKKQLTRKGKRQRLSEGTWRSYRYCLMKLFKFTEKTPDLLIEEALQDNEETENLLIDFKNNLIESGINENVAINVTHGCVRGFFRHNNVNTLNWITPAKTERKVEQIDENNPMFVRQDKNGKKRLVLNRELLREFQSKLSHRDQIILDCLISSGLDSGDLLKLNIGLIRNQTADRIFINSHRAKTLTKLRTFLSLTASKRLRDYVNRERAKAVDEDPIFVISDSERKKIFKRIHSSTEKRNLKTMRNNIRTNTIMQKYQPCQNKIVSSRGKDNEHCWTCGHYSKVIENRCMCCYGILTRPKKHDKILAVKTQLDNIISNRTEPEYRFYIKGWICWIKKSDLEEYHELSKVEKHDKYYHWINSKLENDSIARIFH